MSEINLHYILSFLTGDPTLLSTIVEEDTKEKKKKSSNLMSKIVTEYFPLEPNETQPCTLFPSIMKKILYSKEFVRMGIKNVTEKEFNFINISFLNSLNILLRPELVNEPIEVQLKNCLILEDFITHKLHHNYQVDKVKNTKKIQTINKALINDLHAGKICHELIQKIINIFEINLLVLDLSKTEMYLYWTCGIKHPFFNPFRNLYCMVYVQGNYEPVFLMDKKLPKKIQHQIYINILLHISGTNSLENKGIPTFPPLRLSPNFLPYLNQLEIKNRDYCQIIKIFFHKPLKKNTDNLLKEIS